MPKPKHEPDAVALAVVAGVAIVAALVALSGLLTMLIWNEGITAIVSACGGHVGTISLGVAILANLALHSLGRVLRPAVTT